MKSLMFLAFAYQLLNEAVEEHKKDLDPSTYTIENEDTDDEKKEAFLNELADGIVGDINQFKSIHKKQ